MCNYLVWDKTVQTLDGVFSIASRPGHCAIPTCRGHTARFLSAEGQQIAPTGSTYGYDVLAHIGWRRQECRETYREILTTLHGRVQISESHIRYLYHQVYLPSLACQQRQHRERLAQMARQHGGLIISLDGLAPEGGEPQLWFIRELLTGLTLRSGWLSRCNQPTFEDFLAPVQQLPILAVLSDKQSGLPGAVATVLPDAKHHFCHAHYLDNLAEPLAQADSAFNVALRKAVRGEVGALIRSEQLAPTATASVLTVTGVLPDASAAAAEAPAIEQEPEASVSSEAATAEAIVTQLLRHTRYLLTLKGRPPFCLAGLEAYQRLREVLDLSQELLAHRDDPRLSRLQQGLQAALSPLASPQQELQQGETWLREIDAILTFPETAPTSGEHVAQHLRAYLDTLLAQSEISASLDIFRHHLDKVSRSYWPGLFHCYDLDGLPRTNNELESHFRDTQRRLLRTTGQKGLTRRTLQRTGAWELLPRPANQAGCLNALRQVSSSELAEERQRFQRHQERFQLHTRSAKRIRTQ